MANRTDPNNASALTASGTDPQNFLEYITRQKIYDSRYWKEECFGLGVTDVLKKAAALQCLGGLPTRFLSLCLKLLQLHPDTALIQETFVAQTTFKYVRALGALYIRLTGRPAEVYTALEPLYSDDRRLRYYTAPRWSVLFMDDYIHLLLQPGVRVCGIAVPRLPSRATLYHDGYLEELARPSALDDVLASDLFRKDPVQYLQHKALVEKSPAALLVWNERQQRQQLHSQSIDAVLEGKEQEVTESAPFAHESSSLVAERSGSDTNNHKKDLHENNATTSPKVTSGEVKDNKKEKQKRVYNKLFKTKKSDSVNPKSDTTSSTVMNETNDEEYWNQERAKLGLKPLR